MKKRYGYIIGCILLICLIIGIFLFQGFMNAQSGKNAETELSQADSYVMVLPSYIGEPNEHVEDEINRILEKELQVRVVIEQIDFDHYEQRVKKKIASGEQVDILVNLCNMYVEGVMRKDLLPLKGLLEENGQNIINAVGDKVLETCTINGEIYGIPNIRDHAVRTDTFYLNKEILERNHINAERIKTWGQLEEVFQKVHQAEPQVVILSTKLQSLCLNDYYLSANTSYPIGVLEDRGKGTQYMNLFESDAYEKRLATVRNWYEKGYIRNRIEGSQIVNEEGKIFAFVRCGKPGGEQEMKKIVGEEYFELSLGEDVITQDSYMIFTYGISKNTISPVKSMEILELMYQNEALNNLLKEILPEWGLPNLFLTQNDEGNADELWEATKEFDKNARLSNDVGFVFDPTSVMEEYLNVCEIYNCYRPIIENGIFPYEELLKKMNEEMHRAGIDAVIKEKNNQYLLWKENR